MKKFFSTNNWNEGENPVQFKSLSRPQKSDTTKKPKKKTNNHQSGPPLADSSSPKMVGLKKKSKNILRGRVTKSGKSKLKKEKRLFQTVSGLENSIIPKSKKNESSSLEAKLKENLMGGRFRFINEQLYTMNSTFAKNLFDEDESAFGAYHEGYRHQVQKWPLNPLDKIIKSIKKLPKDFVIGDFGCGEGKMAQSIPNKIFSIDLVACRKDIISSDMANTPLENQCLNVAVYCLSLMGTNLNDYLLEANRCLKPNGLLFIAEIESRFDDVRQFIKSVEACGFTLLKKDTSVKLFIFFQFKKVKNVAKNSNLKQFSLKPCVYRKR